MAELTGRTQIFSGDTADVDTVQRFPVGFRAFDTAGNEYIYCLGIGSTAAGSWVTLDEDCVTTLAVADAQGRVAVAMAATVASTWGWYQIYGKNEIALALTGFADNGFVYLTGTAGSIDDTPVAADRVVGAFGRSAVASGIITVELNYPQVFNEALD
jgi:hypothetical protein